MISVALPSQLPKPARDAITLWMIYDHPKDAPHAYVLRAQWCYRDPEDGPVVHVSHTAWYARTPDELRSILPGSAFPIGRREEDDPKIMEVWIE